MHKTIWISHSAISAFSRCPHLYYLEYEYRNPHTGNRIQVVNPYLSLGLAVHETIESLAEMPVEKRVKISLEERFEKVFANYQGLRGGFISKRKEEEFKKRGFSMVKRVKDSSLLRSPSVKPNTDFPKVDLVKEGDIKLVGKLDWIEALPGGKAHIIDFKTGNNKENGNSLQLPIYAILARSNLSKEVERVSYWYLQHDDHPVIQEMGDLSRSLERIREYGLNIKRAVEARNFPCNYPRKCFACGDYEKIFQGEAEMVEKGKGRDKDLFCVFRKKDVMEKVLEEDFLDAREKKIFEMRRESSMDLINRELRLSSEKSEKIVKGIKEKLKSNLRNKELKVLIDVLSR